ncbi:MAG: phosphoribosylaminoimidazolesuccinocarboxamide synthase [Candidatus Omnitrophica bacterium]|nr:phosphoribosylaminoimidazolesuccinocarboxamide synthase [Candidatus Omnitrophota bacterium]
MTNPCLLKTDFPGLKLFRRGKVRDVYDLGDRLLVVSTDRISCFDVILADGIPDKGRILTQLSCFWFDLTRDIVSNHFITADVSEYPAELSPYRDQLAGRSMLVVKAQPLPVECIVRGYLSGSGWKEYKRSSAVCGISLPAGLRESDQLPGVIFTPSTKAEEGHDQNVGQDYVENLLGKDRADEVKRLSIELYTAASTYALEHGIIIADTKFEFGIHKEKVILIDEVLTPDSSRFWPKEAYEPGKSQPSFDKQFVRDYLESLSWNKEPPPPALPEDIVRRTSDKYRQAYRLLTTQSP